MKIFKDLSIAQMLDYRLEHYENGFTCHYPAVLASPDVRPVAS